MYIVYIISTSALIDQDGGRQNFDKAITGKPPMEM